jgi:hypothetical protein
MARGPVPVAPLSGRQTRRAAPLQWLTKQENECAGFESDVKLQR